MTKSLQGMNGLMWGVLKVSNKDYSIMLEKIKLSQNKETLNKLEKSSVRLYDAGIFNEKELARLDIKIMEKLALIN